jgi:general stress protein 26
VTNLADIAPDFVEIAHRIVWCTVATVDTKGRPRTRILHPIWEWDGASLVGWIATGPDSPKAKHLAAQPKVSLTYWDPSHDVATCDAEASWYTDDETRSWLYERFKTAPPPVGYDPALIPGWDTPTAPGFGALRLDPTALRVVHALDFANATSWRA